MQLASPFAQNELDQETTLLLTRAFDEIWEILQAAGDPLVEEGQAPATRALIAQRILDMAVKGERDLERLIDGALEHLSGTK